MFEVTRKNCYKCDLETVNDNNSQYFWINVRNFDQSTLKNRRELAPNIKFQADRIFARNDLFEKVIKSCKATNAELLMLKENLDICLYEEN